MLRALITSLRFWLVAGALTGCVFAAPERVAEFLRLTLLSPARALDFLPFGRDEITTQVEQLSAENDLLKARLEAAAAPGATRATPTAVPGEIVFTETVPGAAVVARDPSPWGRTVLVNRGRVDGVAPGMTVVAGKVLVGRVIEAGPAVCRVRLVTDPASKIAVTIGKPGTVAVEGEPTPVDRVAVCKGSGRADPGLTVEWLERDVAAGVREGDLVYTSGGEGVFPKGLVVGRVTRLRLEAGAAFAEVTAAPAVDPRRLCRVSLIAAAPAAAGLVADPAAGFIAGDAGDIARAAPYARAPVAR